jgi:hypothetical protein
VKTTASTTATSRTVGVDTVIAAAAPAAATTTRAWSANSSIGTRTCCQNSRHNRWRSASRSIRPVDTARAVLTDLSRRAHGSACTAISVCRCAENSIETGYTRSSSKTERAVCVFPPSRSSISTLHESGAAAISACTEARAVAAHFSLIRILPIAARGTCNLRRICAGYSAKTRSALTALDFRG